MEGFLKNKLQLQVLTDTGWSSFDGLSVKEKMSCIEIKTNSTTLKCTPAHKLIGENFVTVDAEKSWGKNVISSQGIQKITSITKINAQFVFDLVNVKNNNRFFANKLLVKNCNFVIFDETLINPFKLNQMFE